MNANKRLAMLLALWSSVPLFAGDLASRFDLTLNRVLSAGPPKFDEAFVLADVVPQSGRRFTEFSGDVSGRYIGALTAAARHTGQRFPQLDEVVTKTIAMQKADGHFGGAFCTDKVTNGDMAILWGNGRLLA